jgi:hypothetical protein
MQIHTIGIDLGKTIFHLVGLNLRAGLWFAGSALALNCCSLACRTS